MEMKVLLAALWKRIWFLVLNQAAATSSSAGETTLTAYAYAGQQLSNVGEE